MKKLLLTALIFFAVLLASGLRVDAGLISMKVNSPGTTVIGKRNNLRELFVIGKRDVEAEAGSVRVHAKRNRGAKPPGEAIAEILLSIKERRGDHV